MSQKIVSIHAYDSLDRVHYSVSVREYDDYEHDKSELVFTAVGEHQGSGVDDPRTWLEDVLVGLLETI